MSTFGHLIGKPVAVARSTLIHFGYQVTIAGPDIELWEEHPDGELFFLRGSHAAVTSFSRWTEKPALTIDPIARRKR